MQVNLAYHGYSCKGISLYVMNTDLLCVPLVCNLFFNIIYMHLHVNVLPHTVLHTAYPMSVHGVQVLCIVCRFCALCACPVHGVDVLCMVWTFCAWCARSVHGVHVLCMVCTFCAWCARSVHGYSLSISTSQARFQPLYIYMYMYIEVAVCHFIIIMVWLNQSLLNLE